MSNEDSDCSELTLSMLQRAKVRMSAPRPTPQYPMCDCGQRRAYLVVGNKLRCGDCVVKWYDREIE